MNIYLLIELMALLASGGAGVIPNVQQTGTYPVCRPSTRCIKKENKLGNNAYIYEVNGQQMIIDFQDGSHFRLRCNSDNKESAMFPDDFEMPALTWQATVELATFNQCLIPRDSYQAALKAFNVTVTKKLILKLPAESRLEIKHTRGLKIIELDISALHTSTPSHAKFNFSDELSTLRTLKLTDVVLEPEALNRLPGSLEILVLNSSRLAMLPSSMFKGTKLTTITLANNKLASLPEGLFTPLKDSLEELDLSNNKLNHWTLVDAVKPLTSLKTLKANNNPLGSLCQHSDFAKGHLPAELPEKLEQLELRETDATRICTDWIRNDALMDIDLSHNNIVDLSYEDLEMSRTRRGTIKLKLEYNKLSKIKVLKSDYEKCRTDASSPVPKDLYAITRVPVNVSLSSMACDCDAFWLREVLRDCKLLNLASDVECLPKKESHHPNPIEYGMPPRTRLLEYGRDEIPCPYNDICVPGANCSCTKRPRDNATVVWCSGKLPEKPSWPQSAPQFPLALHVGPKMLDYVPRAPQVVLAELHAHDNNITKLTDDDIPETLRVLNVSHNKISHVSVGAAKMLGSDHENHIVSLSGNLLACECRDARTFDLLKPVVEDWNETRCSDYSYVDLKTEKELCYTVWPTIFGAAVPILLCLTGILTVWLLLPRIKQLLFRYNLCLDCIIKTNDIADDPSKTHDAFLSYRQTDFKLLMELKCGLEKLGYSTLEHQNDWIPGDSVQEQIADSVLCARRTILLVTDDYAKSDWTKEEFKIAHGHAIESRKAKVLVINCRLSDPKKLPKKLQVYMKMNTYLEWDDPKFWHKLCRVMPPRREEYLEITPDNLYPPSLLLQQEFPLLPKLTVKPQLAFIPPELSITGPSA